jgi:multidrug efflux pump subunit AcrA (membrane-fusion protein)
VVQPQVISETVNAPCRLEAGSEAVISVSVSGIVEEVLVSPGDTVQAGQRLLVLRTDDIQGAVVREAAAMLSAARASSEYARSNLQRATELVETGAMAELKMKQRRRKPRALRQLPGIMLRLLLPETDLCLLRSTEWWAGLQQPLEILLPVP